MLRDPVIGGAGQTAPRSSRSRWSPATFLFFNGSLVHGSKPNRSTRFRRSLIAHYIQGDAQECAHWYHPALRLDGSTVELDQGNGGGPCGEWVERDGRRVIELSEAAPDTRATH